MNEEMLLSWPAKCPYCDASFEMLIDSSVGSHATWEDCPQCCAPIQVRVTVSPFSGELEDVMLGQDDDVF
ncbi:CPXCG motif-containing cysteine-rich protein [Chromohalobacter beijerinckii]|uniref:CPXCG motif-containing cysteine-rich protein n=1 Tax=Chromohalobacter beijerinckii TaxID=86179 RepID=A0ABV8XH71_9GAMM|nr:MULTISPECIES: CPXCG motif-containing cysteine-rich protein [Chromohalobacter]MCK0765601.1 CPXCG motif-containing cysteine-rich protein [Chromohalobacter beijerinckii]